MPDKKQKQPKKTQGRKLVSEAEFKDALDKVLSVSKEESDDQIARFQASNKAHRETHSPKKKPA